MKKFLVMLIAIVGFGFSVNAGCVQGFFTAKEGGETYWLQITSDCGYAMKGTDMQSSSGDYRIDGSGEKGSSYDIYFNINGQEKRGKIHIPMYGAWIIEFNGRTYKTS